MSELTRESYLSRDELIARLHEGVGFLDGLAAGLLCFSAQDRTTIVDAIYAEVERLKRDLPGEGGAPDD